MLSFKSRETMHEERTKTFVNEKRSRKVALLSILGAGVIALGACAEPGLNQEIENDKGSAIVPKCPPGYAEDLPVFSSRNWYPANAQSRAADFSATIDRLREIVDPDREGVMALSNISIRYRDLAKRAFYEHEVYGVTSSPLIRTRSNGNETRFDDPSESMCIRPNGEGALKPAAEQLAVDMLHSGIDVRNHGYPPINPNSTISE